MPASLFDMRKYASTGIATDGMTAFDKKKALALFGGGSSPAPSGNLLPVSAFEDLSNPSYWEGGYYINYYNMEGGTYTLSTDMPEKDPGDVYFNGENASCVPYAGRPVSIQVDQGGMFYILFFVNRGNYEKILDGTYKVILTRDDK